MFLEVRQRFLIECDDLAPKVRRLFLAGKVTHAEALAFSTRSRLENKHLDKHAGLLHARRHKILKRRHADIDDPHTNIQSFIDELDRMPEHIAVSVMSGRITLVQARFAVCGNVGTKGIQELSRANDPTPPHRERKYAAGTENSVRNPIKVRPINRFMHPATRR